MNYIKIIICLLVCQVHALYGGKDLISDQNNKKDEVTRLMKKVNRENTNLDRKNSVKSNEPCEDLENVSKKVCTAFRSREEEFEHFHFDESDVKRVLVNKKYQKDGEYYVHYTTVLAYSKKEEVDNLSLKQALDQIKADIATNHNKDWFVTLCYCPYVLCYCLGELFELN